MHREDEEDIPRSIMIVEDDPITAKVMASSFEQTRGPWIIEVCDSLALARDRIDGQTFDAVLLDLGLPDALGLEALEPFMGKCAIVIMTGSAAGVGKDAMRLGAEDFIVKGSATPETVVIRTEFAIERFRRGEKGRAEAARALEAAALNRMLVDELLEAQRLIGIQEEAMGGSTLHELRSVIDRSLGALVASHLCLPPKKAKGTLVLDQILKGLSFEIRRSAAEEDDFWTQPLRLVAAVRWFLKVDRQGNSIESIRTQRGRLIIRFKEGHVPAEGSVDELRDVMGPESVTLQSEGKRTTVRVFVVPEAH